MSEAKKEQKPDTKGALLTSGVGLIFKKIPLIMAEIGAIGKDRKNEKQHYSFRGVDDVYNSIHNSLTKHKVFTVPTILSAEHEERKAKSGGALIYRIYTIRYRFYAAEDGSYFDAIVIGEGMDSGDKAGNKAMSVAHKYAMLQVFCVPTEDPKDPENDSHEVGKKKKAEPKKAQKPEDIDIAGDSEDEETETKNIISFVKAELKKQTIDYKNFKKYLSWQQKEFDPPTHIIGEQFGNLSLTVGRLADLRNLKNNLDTYVDRYVKYEMKAAKKREEKANNINYDMDEEERGSRERDND